jgi:hypothetical protein
MKRKYFTIGKYMGDDDYSWAVFKKLPGGGRQVKVTGCAKREAGYHADILEGEERARRGEKKEA